MDPQAIQDKKQPTAKALATYAVKQLFFLFLTGLLLFISFGSLQYRMAWVYLVALVFIVIANTLAMDKTLITERSKLQKGTKKWDIALSVYVAILGPYSVLLISGMDQRFGWSSDTPLWVSLCALAVFLLGSSLATWAMGANKFFASTVRIQDDRAQDVVCTGPYRFIRHPGYLGGIIAHLATPLILGSYYALLVSICVALAFVLRTKLEDKVLLDELPGYRSYAKEVHYRLFYALW